MLRVGVWEQNEGIAFAIAAYERIRGFQTISGRHPAELAAVPLDLLVISPQATGWAGAGSVDCRTVLLPGRAGPLARLLRGECVVSYGTSPKDTLTFSSLEHHKIHLALQRELMALPGIVVERQEFALPLPPDTPPLSVLAAAGGLLLLGIPPEQLSLRWPTPTN